MSQPQIGDSRLETFSILVWEPDDAVVSPRARRIQSVDGPSEDLMTFQAPPPRLSYGADSDQPAPTACPCLSIYHP